MKTLLRIAFVAVPALVAVRPALSDAPHRTAAPIHYRQLDRMIHAFAAQAQAARKVERATFVALR
jgi:hypothetical protein